MVSIRLRCPSEAVACGVGTPGEQPVEPGHRLLAHRPPQHPPGDVARRVAADEVDVAGRLRAETLGGVPGALGAGRGDDDIAVGVLDVDHALGPDDPDLETVHRPGPHLGSAQLMFMLHSVPSSMVNKPKVASLVPHSDSTGSIERA